MNRQRAINSKEDLDFKGEISIRRGEQPKSLSRDISPPTSIRRKSINPSPSTAEVEAGKENVENHLAFFSEKLLAARRPNLTGQSRLDHQAWIDLYIRNLNERGHHFVIHQHDHPVAGTHYDLRLQCNSTSSISFAIMYGLPGDPNSHRLNRNATETRVHNLWNHLIETASLQTGSMLLWDTGEYEVLPWRENQYKGSMTDEDEVTDDSMSDQTGEYHSSEPQKLHQAFQQRRIRLRLNGTKLPQGYTISLRLTTENFRSEQPPQPKRRRQNVESRIEENRRKQRKPSYHTTDSESEYGLHFALNRSKSKHKLKQSLSSLNRYESPPVNPNSQNTSANNTQYSSTLPTPPSREEEDINIGNASSDELDEAVNEKIRQTNAYPGATNSINSIHQRKWFLSLDRHASGFIKSYHYDEQSPSIITSTGAETSSISKTIKPKWIPRGFLSFRPSPSSSSNQNSISKNSNSGIKKFKNQPTGFPPFHVLGRTHERSILTGRLAADILDDEGVYGFVPRGGWLGV